MEVPMSDNRPGDEGDDEVEGEELEAEIMRADHPFASDRFGTTVEEELEGEGLDRALAQEVPEPQRTDETWDVVAEGEPDVEDELVGEAVREQDPYASPEDAALSVRDRAPGATDHDDPHPTEDDPPDED
jgi:hypothetical protein